MGSIRWSPKFCDLAAEQLTVNSLPRAWCPLVAQADISGWSYVIPRRRCRTHVINLQAHIIELLQQIESLTLLWFDGGGVIRRRGPNHDQDT